MPAATASFVLNRVRKIYGRSTKNISANLLMDINNRIEEMCRRWKFWFTATEPGFTFQKQFPFTAQTSMASVVPLFDRWLDRGWFMTVAGQMTYRFAIPTTIQPDPGHDPPIAPDGWIYTEILRPIFLKQISFTGSLMRDLDVINPSDFWSRALYQTQAMPLQATIVTEAPGISQIAFAPTPDDSYPFVFSCMSLPPPLTRPDSTHGMLQYYPRAAVLLGILEAAKYFGEKTEHQFYEAELFGPKWSSTKDNADTPGGLVGQMIADTKARFVQKEQYRGMYTSSRRASGRSSRTGGGVYAPPGSYYDGNFP